jgi:hypothetical protein
VLAALQPLSATIEPIRVQIFSFEIAVNCFTAGACGATSRRRLDDDQRRLVLLRHFCWR